MAKRFVQDVVPAGRRSIRNIPLPESRGGEPEVKGKKVPVEAPIKETRAEKPKNTPKAVKSSSRWYLWLAGIVVVLAGVYFVSYMFVSATVLVNPKEVTTPVSVAGSAKIDPAATGLIYTIVTLDREGGKEVPASGEEKVEKKASGKIVIYNSTDTSQQLVANTRFESTGGLIYRIQSGVTVPGGKTAGGVTTPGSLAVTVYADAAGDKYNIGLSDFTIPGFKGDPKYTKITAKSDPQSQISGGFVGTAKKVTTSDAALAKTEIEASLKKELEGAIQAQIPDTHVLFKNAVSFSFTELSQGAASAPGKTLIREKGTIYGILFERKALSEFLAEKLVTNENRDVLVTNLDTLAFTLDNVNAFSPVSTKEITFKLSGTADFVWNIDSGAISQSLAGQKRANIKDILGNFETVNRASVSIRPVWVFTLPKDPSKITVQIDQAK